MASALIKIQSVIVGGYKDAVGQLPVVSLNEHRALRKFHALLMASLRARKSEMAWYVKEQGLPSDDAALDTLYSALEGKIWDYLTYKNTELTLFNFTKEAEKLALQAIAGIRP